MNKLVIHYRNLFFVILIEIQERFLLLLENNFYEIYLPVQARYSDP